MTSPASIIDTLARERGMVTPVTAAFPLSREFVEACIVARDAELIERFVMLCGQVRGRYPNDATVIKVTGDLSDAAKRMG